MSTHRITSRRNFLAAAAAATAIGIPAVAVTAQNDQIFSAVARCRAAWKEFSEASMFCDDVAARLEGREAVQADHDRYEAACEALEEAVDALIATAPITVAGASAAVTWLFEYDLGCVPEASGRFLRTLAKSGVFNA
jgi:hypothetical protein